MSGRKEGVKETPQQRALVELAQKQVADYRQRWMPLQMRMAQSIDAMGAAGSFERRQAAGMASTENEAQFQNAREQMVRGLGASGQLASSKGKLALAGVAADQATSTGLGTTQADQQIDDAYIAGLTQIMNLGQGQKATAIGGMTHTAAMSGRRAAADASASLARRAGNAQLAGTAVGLGLSFAQPQGGGVGRADLAAANDSADPIGTLNTRLGWTG